VNPNAATLRLALFPRTGVLTEAALIVAGAALVALAAQVRIPMDPVPITGQTFAVLLVGASYGAVRGTASLSLYLVAGLLGAPVYTQQNSGWEYFTGATGGYIIGFVFAAAVTGYLAEQRWDRRLSSAIAAMFIGSIAVYAIGLPWLAAVLNLDFETTLKEGLAPFVPGDLLKLFLAAALLPTAWRLVDRATGRRP
jgi:biotin transport system substrate-specific component